MIEIPKNELCYSWSILTAELLKLGVHPNFLKDGIDVIAEDLK